MPTLVQFDFPAGPVGRRDGHRFRDLAVIIGPLARSPLEDLDGERDRADGRRHLPVRGRGLRARLRRGAHGPARRLRRDGHPRAGLRGQRAAHGDDARSARRRVTTTLEPAGSRTGVRPTSTRALTRVWFSDTDAQGVVYYGRYLPYFDHAHRVPPALGSLRLDGAEFVMRAWTSSTTRPRGSTTSSSASSASSGSGGRASPTTSARSAPGRHADGHRDADARPRRSQTRRPTPIPARASRSERPRARTSSR